MTLQELQVGQKITLEVVWGEHRYQIPTQVVGSNRDGLLLTPFSYKGTVLDLNAGYFKDMVYNLYYNNEVFGQRTVFQNVFIQSKEFKGVTYYVVHENAYTHIPADGDRREHPRMIIEKPAIIEMDAGRTLARVHDISDNGISILTPKGLIPEHTNVRIAFEDHIRGHYFNLFVEAWSVRHVEHKGSELVGCKILNVSRDLLAYVYLKRTEDAHNNNEEKP